MTLRPFGAGSVGGYFGGVAAGLHAAPAAAGTAGAGEQERSAAGELAAHDAVATVREHVDRIGGDTAEGSTHLVLAEPAGGQRALIEKRNGKRLPAGGVVDRRDVLHVGRRVCHDGGGDAGDRFAQRPGDVQIGEARVFDDGDQSRVVQPAAERTRIRQTVVRLRGAAADRPGKVERDGPAMEAELRAHIGSVARET